MKHISYLTSKNLNTFYENHRGKTPDFIFISKPFTGYQVKKCKNFWWEQNLRNM